MDVKLRNRANLFHRKSSSDYSLVILVLIIGLVLTLITFTFFRYLESQKIAVDFERTAINFGFELQGQIEKRIYQLESIASLYAASQEVTREEFSEFVKPFLGRDRTIQALQWVQRVPANQRAHYEFVARNDGFPGFEITELDESGAMIQAGHRTEYYPVYFLEPYEGNEIAFGFDLSSDPGRLEAMSRARDLGKAVASGPVKLVQDSRNQKGLLIFWPIQRNKTPSDSLTSRRENLMGFAVEVFRIGDLMTAVLKDSPLPDLDFYFLDETYPGKAQILYSRTSNLDSSLDHIDPHKILKQPASKFSYDMDLDIGERKWGLLFEPGPGYIAKRRTWQPWVVLLGGMILTGIAMMYMTERSRVQKERRQAEEAVEFLAYHDPLTKLPNRSLIQRHLQEAILKARRENHPAAFLLMDLEHFKEINDTLGHHRGDEVLKQVGLRLQSVLWEPDVVSRLGGDEFAVLLPNLAASEHIMVVVKKILSVLEAPFMIDGLPIHVETSIGIALYPDQGTDGETLMRRADIAMYAAKKGGSGYAIYTSEQDEYSPKRLALMGELRQAIEQDQLFLHYQPKVSLKTGRSVGVEALVRWQHPEHGFIPPIDFIGPAERTGLIKPLTECILEKALQQCHLWHKAGLELSMSVNLSARYLGNPELAARIMEGLHRFNLEPRFLELEITESAIMSDPSRAMDLLGELTKLGVRISIDDFGTGYSSLGYLKKLPVYAIKIDKSFVMNIHENKIDASIVECTIRYGHNLGLEVVAEGVENKQAWDQLVNLGCDLAQGYYMCRPLPAAELTKWMSEPPWGITVASPGI